MKTLTAINSDLKHICKAFNLGDLKSYKTEVNTPINGFNTATFNTSKENNLKYHYKK